MNLFFFDSLTQNLMLLFVFGVLVIYLVIYTRHKNKVIIQRKHHPYEKAVTVIANIAIVGFMTWLGFNFGLIGTTILLGLLFVLVVNTGLLSYGLTDEGIQYTGEVGSIKLIRYSEFDSVQLEEHDDFLRLKFSSKLNFPRRLDFPLSKEQDIIQLLKDKQINIQFI